MAFQKFIKENLALTVGISLPLLLIIIFSLVTTIPKYTTPPPQHEIIFSISEYLNNNAPEMATELKVKNGKIYIKAFEKKKNSNGKKHRIYVYNAQKDSVREIAFDIPNVETEILLKETKDFTISNESKAPDGYAIHADHYTSGLMQEIFIGGRSRNQVKIEKGMVAYKIPSTDRKRYYSHNFNFLGWIIQKGEK